MDGAVDGGDGIDTFTIDSTGGGSVNGGQFVNFEIFNQIGAGSLSYSGAFEAQTISLTASQATVAEGTTVSSAGPVTFTGTDAAEQLRNFGAIAGGVQLGGGVDSIENFGTIGRSVDLGDGDDMFTQGAGSSVVGIVDGGGGRDGWIVVLNGDREGLGARTGFEHLGVIGSGTLSLTLDQDWDAIALAGTGLDLRLAGHAPGRISGGDGEEQLRIDGDVTSVSLGGGNDGLTLGGTQFAGTYVGGAGTDSLRFEDGGTVSLSGTVTGFETVALAGNELLVSGTLGAQGDAIGFGAGDQRVEILAGGTVAGALDLGEGADVLRLAAGARLTGSVSGGAGADLAILELTPEQALDAGKLQNFETLRTSGTGMLHFASGAAAFDLLESGGSTVMVDAGASLQAGALRFGDNSDRFTLAGSFTGQASLGGGDDVLRLVCNAVFAGGADAGAGNDRLEIAMGGTAATPVALGNASFTNFEVLDMQSGIVSYAGDSRFGAVNIIGGRLIGLAGSRLTGGRFDVAAGATFGSAGTVVGDVVVAGTLSPGASPGTMTVAGNVALSSRSTSLFELSAAASDQLRVSGALTIASGASLLLTGTRPLTPGVTLDLIVADGGITGSFASIDKPATIQGFLSQSATRLQLLGTFLADPTFSPQVRSTIDYVNAVLIAGQASPALIAAVPSLLTPSGGSNAAAFRQLGPEAHASASQFGTEQALNVVEAARSQMMTAPNRSGMFTFGQMLTNNRRLGGDGVQGTASARMQSYGGLAGLGWGREDGWIGAFVGYQDGHQTIADLGSRTEADSVMVGVQGQASSGALTLNVIAAHSDGKADTRRSVLGNMLSSRYALNSWISDVRASYAVSLGDSWSLQPGAGLTGIRTTRGNATETGAGPFGLTVETNRATRWFADGELTLRGGMGAGERFHPYISGGVRLQFDGRGSFATASFVNVATRFTLPGLERDRTLVTARAGMRYDATERLSFHASYAGEYADQSRHYGSVGLRLAM
ncbi:MAG: autotransporter domain-containing protein [Sphingobium sp.]|nr:autotransporter domain-containing protein [Sphingobium sp.]